MSVCTRNASCTCPLCNQSKEDMKSIPKVEVEIIECTGEPDCQCQKCHPENKKTIVETQPSVIACNDALDCPCDDCKLPLVERILQKKWTIRKKVYTDILKLLNTNVENPSTFSDYSYFIKPAISDSSVPAQLAGLETLLFYLQYTRLATDEIIEYTSLIVDHVFTSVRDKNSNKGIEVLDLLMKDKSNRPSVLDGMHKGLSQRTPKMPISIITVMKNALILYGPKDVPIMKYYETIGPLAKQTNISVVRALKEFLIELFRYTRESVNPWITKANSALLTQLQPKFDEISLEPLPDICGTQEVAECDWDSLPPVDLKKSMKSGDYDTKIESPKWSDKCEALDVIINACGKHPKIIPGDYSDFYHAVLKLATTESNLQVQIHAFTVIWCLIEGLRSDIKRDVRGLIKKIIPYYKNTKPQLEEILSQVIRSVNNHCISFEATVPLFNDNISTTQPFPQVRASLLKYITSQLSILSDTTITALYPGLLPCFPDGNKMIREAIADFMLELLKLKGEANSLCKYLLTELGKSNLALVKKIQGSFQTAGKSISKTVPPKKVTPKVTSQPIPKSQTLKPTLVKPKVQKIDNSQVETQTPLEPMITTQDAIGVLENSSIPEWEIITESLIAPSWSEKSVGYSKLKEFVSTLEDESDLCEPIIVYLHDVNKGFKIGMLNLALNVYEILQIVALKVKKSKKIFHFIIVNTIEKISEKRLAPFLYTIYSQANTTISPKWTIELIIPLVTTQKSTSVPLAVLNYLNPAIQTFGCKQFGTKIILDYLVPCLQSPTSTLKTEALLLINTLYEQLGPKLLPLLTPYNLPPSLLKTIETATSQLMYNEDYKPEIEVESDEGTETEDILQKVDVSKELELYLEQMNNETNKDAWKIRLQGMNDLITFLQTQFAIELTETVKDVMMSLKDRIKTEPNQNLQAKGVEAIGFLATCIGPEVAQFNKYVLPNLFALTNSNRKNLTVLLYPALDKWVEHDGDIATFNSVIPFAADALRGNKNKEDLLDWLSKYLTEKHDVEYLIDQLVEAMQDGSKSIRDLAEICLTIAVKKVGRVPIQNATRDIKPAGLRLLQPKLEQIYLSASLSGSIGPSFIVPPTSQSNQIPGRKNSHAKTTIPTGRPATASSNPTAKTSIPGIKLPRGRVSSISDSGSENDMFTLCPDVLKNDRVSRDRSNWATVPIRENLFIEDVQSLIQPYIPSELFTLMFSKKDTDILAAIQTIIKAVQTNPDEVISVLDLLLKYITIKLVARENTQQNIAIVELYKNLFTMLVTRDYHFLDKEIQVLLPTLIDKFLGSNKPRFVKAGHDLMNFVWSLYEPEKIVPFLLDQLDNKNKRIVAECSAEINILIRDKTSEALPQKGLKKCIRLVGVDDKDVRNSALEFTTQLYVEYEYNLEKVYSIVPDLPKKSQDLIAERIRHSGIEVPDIKQRLSPQNKKSPSRIPTAKSSPPRVTHLSPHPSDPSYIPPIEFVDRNGPPFQHFIPSPVSDYETNTTSVNESNVFNFKRVSVGDSYVDSPLFYRDPLKQEEPEEEPIIDKIIHTLKNVVTKYRVTSSPSNVIELYRSEHNDAVDSCKVVVKLILEGEGIDELINMRWDELVAQLTIISELSLGKDLPGNEVDSRMLSVTLSSFMAIFGQPRIAQLISEKSLENLLVISLAGLLGDTLQSNDQLKDLAQAFQHILIRVLQSSNTTLLLAAICKVITMSDITEPYLEQKLQVLLKMLDKIRHAEAKHLNPYERINPEILLPSLNNIYSSFIYRKYNQIIGVSLGSFLHDYIKSQGDYLQPIITKLTLQEPLLSEIIRLLKPEVVNDVPEEHSDEEDNATSALEDILKNITTEIRQLQRQEINSCPSIQELHSFTKSYPDIDITPYLDQLGAIYCGYVQRELDTLSAKDRTVNLPTPIDNRPPIRQIDVKERLRQLKSQYNLPATSATTEHTIINTHTSDTVIQPTVSSLNDDPRMIAIREKILKLKQGH